MRAGWLDVRLARTRHVTLPPEARAAHAVRLILVAKARETREQGLPEDGRRTLLGAGAHARLDARQALVAELRVFGGLSIQPVARILGATTREIDDDWVMARTWMFDALQGQ